MIIPIWVKPVAYLAVAATIFGFGVTAGMRWEEAAFDRYKLKVQEQELAQTKVYVSRITKQKDINLATETRLNKRIRGLTLKYDRVLNSATTRPVPPVSQAPVVVDATSPQCIPVERINTVVADYNQLAKDCTVTTVIADEWQKWAIENLKND